MATKKSNRQLWIMLALIVAIVAAMIFLPSCGSRRQQQQESDETETTTLVKAGAVAPDFTVTMFDGDEVHLASLRGKVVLLNFWATWCPPCREELKRVQSDIVERFAGREFVFLPVSRGEERDAVAAFREQNGYTFPMGLDPERKIYDLFASNFIPRNFLIDKDGKVLVASVGYEPEEFDELLLAIEKALAE